MSNKTSPADALQLAVQLHQRGRLEEAEPIYREVLRAAPKNPDALHYLGVLSHQRGQGEAAVGLIRRAIRNAPGYADAHNNLGNVLKELGWSEEAEAAYRKVLSLQPRHPDAHNNLGTVLRQQGRYDQAIEAYRSSLRFRPDRADVHHNLGNVLKANGQLEEALTEYVRAIEIDPSHADARLSLGRALYSFGRIDEAATVFRRWLEVSPGNPVAEHMLAGCTGVAVPARASAEFVRETFDRFAGSFDEVLGRLEYKAPGLVAAALGRVPAPPDGGWEVLDAGCGTGLCGPLLRPFARRLVGVDLSPGMLRAARATGAYHNLAEADLTEYMDGNPGCYDAVVSADTLVYFGALEPVFAAAARAMRAGGHLVFTVEHAWDDPAPFGYRLHPHGRYSHRREYLEGALAGAGLTPVESVPATLRQEVRRPVAGLVITARKGAAR